MLLSDLSDIGLVIFLGCFLGLAIECYQRGTDTQEHIAQTGSAASVSIACSRCFDFLGAGMSDAGIGMP